MYAYREAARDDFDVIAAFPQDRKEAFFMYPRGTYPLRADELYEASSTRVIPTVIHMNGEIVGYGNVYGWNEGENCSIGNVIINPNFRGQGAGKYLIEVLKKRAREELKVKEVNLVCHHINTTALLFYTKLGFKPYDIKAMRDHDQNEVAGIFMKIKLDADSS